MSSSGEDSHEENSGRYSYQEDSEDQEDWQSVLYYSSDSLREYIQKGYDAENSSSGFSDDDDEHTTILSHTNSDTNDSMDDGEGDKEYDDDYERSRYDGSDDWDDKISSSLMNEDSVDSVGKSCSSSSGQIQPGSDKFQQRFKSNRGRETGREQSKRNSSEASHFLGKMNQTSVVKFQQSAMAKPLMKRFLHDNCAFQWENCDYKHSLDRMQGDDEIQDEFTTPSMAAAKRRFDGNDERKIGHAATNDHGNMPHRAKRMKNRNQKEVCREKQRGPGSDRRQDSARNAAFSVASTWSSSITTTATSAASSSAASSKAQAASGSSDTKYTKSTQKKQSLEPKYNESGYGSAFCDKGYDLKTAFSAASFSTTPGAMKKDGAINDTVCVKSGRRKSGNTSMWNKTSHGAGTKQQSSSSVCSGASQTDEDDPGYPYFNYVDHSLEGDDEPLVFLVPPSRVATFPVKMHVILSRKDLSHVICWMPHGRSWRLEDPVEFEMTVIPTYFGHASLSSFMRQASGWGFKRITKGRDRNSYYHEHFLRGLPHLCKKIPPPGSIRSKPEKTDVSREPDFAEISKNRPLPLEIDSKDVYAPSLETIGKCILEDGPKARIPIICTDDRTASNINEAESSTRPLSSSIVKTDHSDKKHNSSASQQLSKANNEAILTSPSGSNALMPNNTESVAAPQSTLVHGFEAINCLLQLQQHQLPQPEHVYHQLNNQQPPQVQLANTTNSQTIQQLQMMLVLHLNPSMLASSTVLNSSGVQAPHYQHVSVQNNTLQQQNSQQVIDPNILTLAWQIIQMNATGGQTLHNQRTMESNTLADFDATNGNVAFSQSDHNNTTAYNQNLTSNPQNDEALATQIFGFIVHQYGQQQVHRQQHQHQHHHQQLQLQPQQIQHQHHQQVQQQQQQQQQ